MVSAGWELLSSCCAVIPRRLRVSVLLLGAIGELGGHASVANAGKEKKDGSCDIAMLMPDRGPCQTETPNSTPRARRRDSQLLCRVVP